MRKSDFLILRNVLNHESPPPSINIAKGNGLSTLPGVGIVMDILCTRPITKGDQ